MVVKSEADIEKLVQADAWMMDVLRAAEKINLSDWWIGAGFLRNKVWDALEGKTSQPTRDVDLVYFTTSDVAPETDWLYDEKMKQQFPFAEWEIRNQARMHYVNDLAAFTSSSDGIAHWVETATCIAVKLEGDDLKFLFCYGTDDLYGLVARPTPFFEEGELLEKFRKRVDEKHWREKWPNLQVVAG
jgi:hypothetical protein